MYKHILVPTDGSELATKGVTHGLALAKATGARVTALTVTAPFHVFALDPEVVTDTPDSYARHAKESANRILTTVTKAAKAMDVAYNAVHLEHEHPYEAIIKTAKSNNCDLIVMASHGRHGVSAIVLGSETVKVLTHAKIPVLVYR
jgi:nucleotide-binding universal stress UspA family protein